jgi:hypothetical protein
MATINPRTLFQAFLNAPKPSVLVTGASRPGQPSAVGAGIWQINPKATFNGNALCVPILLHNVMSSNVNALIYPGYFDTVLWFDYATAAVIGVNTYGSNWSNQIGSNNSPWFLENTKATQLPNSPVTVNYLTSPLQPAWVSSQVTTTFRATVPFTLTGQQDPYTVGAPLTLPAGRSVKVVSSLNTVGINNVVRLRYNISAFTNTTATLSENFDFYFNVSTGFIYADFPEQIINRNTNATFSKVSTTMRWTAVSGF